MANTFGLIAKLHHDGNLCFDLKVHNVCHSYPSNFKFPIILYISISSGHCIQVDPSKARNHGGSGLGLAICKRLVEAMGGKIWAESDGLGRGSCFHFTIKSPDQSKWPSHKTPCTSSEPSMNQSGQGSDQLPDPATIQGLKLPQNLPREKGPVGLDCLPVKHESQNEHHRNGPNMSGKR